MDPLDTIWSFGYGSNMHVESLRSKKGIQVLGKYFASFLTQI